MGTRQRHGAQDGVDLAPYSARADQDQPLGSLGELVGELHRHSPAEGMPDQRGGLDVERGQQIAYSVGVGGHRVVGARFVGRAVAEQVGGDHGMGAGQVGDQLRPGRGGVAYAVDQDERRSLTGHPVGAPVAVHDTVAQTQFSVTDRTQPRGAPRLPGLYVDHGLTSRSQAAAKAAPEPPE